MVIEYIKVDEKGYGKNQAITVAFTLNREYYGKLDAYVNYLHTTKSRFLRELIKNLLDNVGEEDEKEKTTITG